MIDRLNMKKILEPHKLNDLNELSSFVFRYLTTKSKTVDYSTLHDETSRDGSSDDDSSDDENDNQDISNDNINTLDESDDDLTRFDDNYDVTETTKKEFCGMRIVDDVQLPSKHHYFEVIIDDKKKFIHKQTTANILTNDKNYLSSDRLLRVKQMNYQK